MRINKSANRTSFSCPSCGRGSHCRIYVREGEVRIGGGGKGLYCKKEFEVTAMEIIEVEKPIFKEVKQDAR